MTGKITPKSILNRNKNLNKLIKVEDILLNNITINDLVLNKDKSNFDNYINLKSLLSSVSSCQISDAYSTLTRKSAVVTNLKSVNDLKAYGSITTCETSSDDWGTSALAIDEASKGDILFLVASDDTAAIWGELASVCAKSKGIKAAAIFGASRDLDALVNLDFPVFSCKSIPNAGMPLGLGKINSAVVVNNLIISPNDFFFGDENGVVVIPNKLFKEVMIETLNIKLKENNIVSLIESGKTLSEIVGLNSSINTK